MKALFVRVTAWNVHCLAVLRSPRYPGHAGTGSMNEKLN